MKITPIAAGERTAARIMDMSVERFLDLVARGALPAPKTIAPGVERWSVAELQAVLDGTKMDRDEITW